MKTPLSQSMLEGMKQGRQIHHELAKLFYPVITK